MITKLRVENFKCLRDVEVDLEPFTVLIGQNDTGKTSFLEAIQLLAATLETSAPRRESAFSGSNAIANLTSRGVDPPFIEWEATLGPSARNGLPGACDYRLQLGPSTGAYSRLVERLTGAAGTLKDEVDGFRVAEPGQNEVTFSGTHPTALASLGVSPAFPMIREVAALLRGVTSHAFVASAIGREAALATGGDPEPGLGFDGSGLALVLDYLLGTNRAAFDAIERDLCAALPAARAILVKPHAVVVSGQVPKAGRRLAFRLANGESVDAPLVSDGLLLFLAYLTLVHGSKPYALLLEEPENGVHPRQLGRIAGYLKGLTEPARGKDQVQIVVTTHSPYLLDFVPPECVRVFGRRANGETVVKRLLDLPGVRERLDGGFSLGELWFNVGEEKLLAEYLT